MVRRRAPLISSKRQTSWSRRPLSLTKPHQPRPQRPRLNLLQL
uniref:Uncharacterized protein n=1 Tax=Arundo donax TaxID=35708 RepID=A0A0A9EK96_ARUDO